MAGIKLSNLTQRTTLQVSDIFYVVTQEPYSSYQTTPLAFSNLLKGNAGLLKIPLDQATASYTTVNGLSANWILNGGNNYTTGVSIGTTNTQGLSVITNNTARLFVDAGGNVGIGTINPGSKLTVSGAISSNNSIVSRGLFLDRVSSSVEGGQLNLSRSKDNKPIWNIDVYGSQVDPNLRIFMQDDTTVGSLVEITTGGKVGIGTVPTDQLHVYGDQDTVVWARVQNAGTDSGSSAGFAAVANGANNYSYFAQHKSGYAHIQNHGAGCIYIDNESGQPIVLSISGLPSVTVGSILTEMDTDVSVTGNLDIGGYATAALQFYSPSVFSDTLSSSNEVYGNCFLTNCVTGNSNNWTTAYTVLKTNACCGKWDGTTSTVNTNNTNWTTAYTVLKTDDCCAKWDANYSNTNSCSSNWDTSYTVLKTNACCGKWDNTYSTVRANSGSWGASGPTYNTGCWDSTYTTVKACSANWDASYSRNVFCVGGNNVSSTCLGLGAIGGTTCLALKTSNNDRMFIDPNGNVGINCNTPGATLAVNGSFAISGKGTSASTASTDAGITLVTKDYVDNNVTSGVPAGSIVLWPKNTGIPNGWLCTNGDVYSSGVYSGLATAIGT
ncbi:MAG: tail fiber protein, partial [Proteobacteria bacterium]|nr:tail fiber protein [Pseudomonadota bacterium]